MALTETATSRRIVNGSVAVQITLSGTVKAGDPIMYSSGWKLSNNTSGAPAVLFAGAYGVSGDVITAYQTATIELTHTAANKPTLGQIVAVKDDGTYGEAGAGLQDIGYIVDLDAATTHSLLQVAGFAAELDTAGT
jgi:hypothetical protein